MLADEDMVGKVILYGEIMFAEERENLFPISLMGDIRERRDVGAFCNRV